MSDPAPVKPSRFRTGGLSPRKPTHFSFAPDVTRRAEMAKALHLLGIKALTFNGTITPTGREEMTLAGTLIAAIDQACVVTLVPVPARITEDIRRRYVAGLPAPEGDEAEMPEDDSVEPMPEVIDLEDIVAEALVLALPLYPRAPGAELGTAVFAPEGVIPVQDADLRPFAGLAGLAGKLLPNPGDEGSNVG